MTPSRSKARAAHAAKVTARSAQSSGLIKCYVDRYVMPTGMPDLRLREKITRRIVRILAAEELYRAFPPLANLLQDCYAHGRGLVEPKSRSEHIVIHAPIHRQDADEVIVLFDSEFSLHVNIQKAGIPSPPVSIWCYIEEYQGEDGNLGIRLRQKVTGRKVEMYGESAHHLTQFLASPQLIGARSSMQNLYEREGFRDYVLVSGGTSVDSYDVILFQDGASLTYLLGPTPDTAYRDAFRLLEEESAAVAHARTASSHFQKGQYREAVLSARLAVEMACGGTGSSVKSALKGAPADVQAAATALYETRHVAVHEGGTRVEQQDARRAVQYMNQILKFIDPGSGQP